MKDANTERTYPASVFFSHTLTHTLTHTFLHTSMHTEPGHPHQGLGHSGAHYGHMLLTGLCDVLLNPTTRRHDAPEA